MKINELLPGQQPIKTTAGGRSATGVSFQDLLTKQLENVSASQAASPLVAGDEIKPASSTALRLDGLFITEDILNNFELFGAALANQQTKVADLEPFVSALEEETSALVALKADLPDSDPLAALLDRVAAAAYVETAKYRRGDYAG